MELRAVATKLTFWI